VTTATTTSASDVDTDTAAVTYVTVDAAAALANVSPRTVRRWIQKGFLPSQRNHSGHVVSPADLPAAKVAAGHGRGHSRDGLDHGHGHGQSDADVDTNTGDSTVVYTQARAQLEAIRDEWLTPYVDKIERLSRENGRLEAERDAAQHERDELRRRVAKLEVEQDIAASRQDAPRTATGADAPESPFVAGPPAWRRAPEPEAEPPPILRRPWWRRLLGLP
jgi:hypothetical protein